MLSVSDECPETCCLDASRLFAGLSSESAYRHLYYRLGCAVCIVLAENLPKDQKTRK